MTALWTVNDVSEFLKLRVGSIYNLVSQRKIPFLKVNGSVRFSPEELEKWIQGKNFLSSKATNSPL
jgi:excisionase family DNA binding protein